MCGGRQIIGVAGDARNDGVDRPVVPAIYLPYTVVIPSNVQFFVRTQGDPLTYLHSMRAAIASVASDQQISNSTFNGTFTLNEAIERDAQYSRQRLFSILSGAWAAIALALAAVGIVIGLAFDSFLGGVLAHWMQSTFAAGSLFAAAALLALSALLACLLPARHAIAVPPAESLRYE